MSTALMELGAIVGPEKADALKAWCGRWIDEAATLVALSPLDELQLADEDARMRVMTYRVDAHVCGLARSLVTREGVMAKEAKRLPGGGREFSLALCVMRAEPKE